LVSSGQFGHEQQTHRLLLNDTRRLQFTEWKWNQPWGNTGNLLSHLAFITRTSL